MKKFVYIILVLTVLPFCGNKTEEVPLPVDPFYKDDIPYPGNGVKPPENWQPVPGKTTEEEVLKTFKERPTSRRKFKTPVYVTLKNKKYKFNKILEYGYSGTVSTPSQGAVVVDMVEQIAINIFLMDGIVQAYTAQHIVREPGNTDWKIGKYHTDDIDINSGEFHPGGMAIQKEYHIQRGYEWTRKQDIYTKEYLLEMFPERKDEIEVDPRWKY